MNARSSGTNTRVTPKTGDHQPRHDHRRGVADQQQLPPQPQPPAPVAVQLRHVRHRRRAELRVHAQQQELEQDRRHEGVERVEVAVAQEQEERREAGEGGDEDALLRPVQPAPDAPQRQAQVHHAQRDHRARPG